MKNKLFFLSALFLALVIFQPANAQPRGNSPTGVFVFEVIQQPISDRIEALGTLQSNDNVILTSTVTERVTKILFEDGQRVEKGDMLVKMDDAEEQAQLAEEQSVLEEAEQQLNRIRPLVEQGTTSQARLDEALRNFNASRARVNAIQSRIEQRAITAPFSGVAGLRNISVGALAQPGTMITTIDDDSVMKLDFSIPELYVPSLKQGMEIKAKTRAFPGQTFTGTVSAVSNRIDPVTRAVTARALLNNDEGLLKAGMLMRVELEKNNRNAMMIPEEAIIQDANDNFVYVVRDQEGQTVASKQIIKQGVRREGNVEVTSGLNVGDRVITHGIVKLRPNAPVAIKAVQRGNETLDELLGRVKKNSSEEEQG